MAGAVQVKVGGMVWTSPTGLTGVASDSTTPVTCALNEVVEPSAKETLKL